MANFGALVFSPSTRRYGASWAFPSPEAAQQAALDNCAVHDATVLSCVADCWVALAVSPSGAYGWGSGGSPEDAADRALAECRKYDAAASVEICFSTSQGQIEVKTTSNADDLSFPILEYRKGYHGVLDHDDFALASGWFVSFLTGYLGWEIAEPLNLKRLSDRPFASTVSRRAYGAGFVYVKFYSLDNGIFNDSYGHRFQRLDIGGAFYDPNGWTDRRAEDLLHHAMREMDAAMLKIGRERIFQFFGGTPGG